MGGGARRTGEAIFGHIKHSLLLIAYIVTENTAVFLFIGYLWVACEKSVPLIGRRRGEQEHVQAN